MEITGPVEPITANDAEIEAALADADLPPLLAALAHVTGDLEILRSHLRPDASQLFAPNGGMSHQAEAEARAIALEVLARYRDRGCPPVAPPTVGHLRQMLGFLVGDEVDLDEYLPLFREELGVEGHDMRAPDWHLHEVAPDRSFRVGVIGAGMSGLVAAHRLSQAGVPFVVLEKNHDVGGTWLENTYPGCRVDVSNHLYSYSFAQRADWPQHFSTQEVLLDYFRACAERFELRDHIRFGTEVTSAEWDDERATYTLCLRCDDGTEDTIEVNAVISGVGQLNRPRFPDLPGMDRFDGPSFHSARWDHHVDLAGKRVGVIGTGASAVQFIPEIADEAAEVVVFQRTPPWLIPTPDYHAEVPDGLIWLLRHVPTYAHWHRFWLFWRNAEGLLPMVTADSSWEGEGAVSQMNDLLRQILTGYLQGHLADRPDLLEAILPDYPPAAKRALRDNGIWPATLKRDDVQLVTGEIAEITEAGIRSADGTEHPVDVIIYGTGFTASDFLMPMKVVGRGGVDLHETWDGDARAFLGVVLPHFPNFFMLYGPNTNIVVNGSIIYFSECEVDFAMRYLHHLLANGLRGLDVKPEAHEAYNERIDAGNLGMAWGQSDVSTWYRNARGRISQNWPFSLLEYWQQTRQIDPDHYDPIP